MGTIAELPLGTVVVTATLPELPFKLELPLYLAVIGNVVRLTTIIVAAETFGQSAGNYVHESFLFSLLPYVPPILGLMILGHWLEKRTENPVVVWKAKPV